MSYPTPKIGQSHVRPVGGYIQWTDAGPERLRDPETLLSHGLLTSEADLEATVEGVVQYAFPETIQPEPWLLEHWMPLGTIDVDPRVSGNSRWRSLLDIPQYLFDRWVELAPRFASSTGRHCRNALYLGDAASNCIVQDPRTNFKRINRLIDFLMLFGPDTVLMVDSLFGVKTDNTPLMRDPKYGPLGVHPMLDVLKAIDAAGISVVGEGTWLLELGQRCLDYWCLSTAQDDHVWVTDAEGQKKIAFRNPLYDCTSLIANGVPSRITMVNTVPPWMWMDDRDKYDLWAWMPDAINGYIEKGHLPLIELTSTPSALAQKLLAIT